MKRIISLLVGLVMIVGLGACATIRIQDKDLLYSETGWNLAYYLLQDESQAVRERTESAIHKALTMLETEDVTVMVDLIIDYIEDQPQFQDNQYKQLVMASIRMLKGILVIDLEIPEEHAHAVKALETFLTGALDGVRQLM